MHTLMQCLQRLRVLGVILMLAVLTAGLVSTAQAADPDQELNQAVGTINADTWREVKNGENFIDTRHDSTYSLINTSGETWRQIRNDWISPAGLIALGSMLAILVIFYLIVGRNDLDEERTGRKLLRWTALERAMHWTVATLFIVLALTGLNLLYGKFVFRHAFGDAFWANLIALTKLTHNYVGPVFGILLLLMLAKWLTVNLPRKHDWQWFKQGGGMVGNKHPDAGFANGGEKAWYWILASVGLLVIVSGFVLDFPLFGQTRDNMQWANMFHAVTSLILMAVALGHIYIGTLGTEGALEGMTTGYVDETWAKQHHNLWYEEVKDSAGQPEQENPPVDDDTATANRPN